MKPVALGCLTVALACISAAGAAGLQPIPALSARVTDLTGTLTGQQQSALEAKLADFERRKGSQIGVLIVPTTAPEEIDQYSIRVVDQWKLGRRKVDDGALLIIAKNDRVMRIEVGKGLEGALTDLTSHRIISETITPHFRQGDFYAGINAGLDQIIQVIDGEPLPPPEPRWQDRSGRDLAHTRDLSHLLPILFFAVLFGSTLLRSVLGRGLGAVVLGVGTGAVVYFLAQALTIAAAAGLIAFFFSLLTGAAGTGGWSSYPRGGGWGGFGGGWGGGLGGGGGGFGGGGGGFNGGGASGRW